MTHNYMLRLISAFNTQQEDLSETAIEFEFSFLDHFDTNYSFSFVFLSCRKD